MKIAIKLFLKTPDIVRIWTHRKHLIFVWKNFCKNAIVKVNDLHLYKPFKTDEAKKIKRALFERGKKPQGILLVVFIV